MVARWPDPDVPNHLDARVEVIEYAVLGNVNVPKE